MYKKNILFFLLLCINLNYNWQNQNNISIEKSNIIVYGVFEGRKFNTILLNNNTEITLYEKPLSKNGDPNLFQQKSTLVPDPRKILPTVKQIQYIEPSAKSIPDKIPTVLTYNNQKWYEVKLTFTNNEVKYYLLPVSNKITMIDSELNMHSTIDISRLTGEGIIIKGAKQNEKSQIQNEKNSEINIKNDIKKNMDIIKKNIDDIKKNID